MMMETYTSNNDLDELNFGFDYDDITSVNSNDLNTIIDKQHHDNLLDFKNNKKYYNMDDIIAYNSSSFKVSSSPDIHQILSPSSLNYKIWLQQQVSHSQ